KSARIGPADSKNPSIEVHLGSANASSPTTKTAWSSARQAAALIDTSEAKAKKLPKPQVRKTRQSANTESPMASVRSRWVTTAKPAPAKAPMAAKLHLCAAV